MNATRSLSQCANDAIDDAIEEAADDDPTILWWDNGGYLRDIVKNASTKFDCGFRAAEQTPLELRADAPRGRTIWYVPQPNSDDADWFKDIENTGRVVEQHIGKLAARCFENDRLQATAVRTAYEDTNDRERVAQTLYEGLNGEGGLPTLKKLQTEIVLEGHDDPVQFVLEHDAEELPDGDDLLKIRDLLVDDGVAAVEGESDARTIVDCTRRWAVAEWLITEGLGKALFPKKYRSEPNAGIGVSRPELQSVLSKTERKQALANIYLDPDQRFWQDILDSYDDPWEIVNCPVGASLEHRLWEEWQQSFEAEDYETCAAQARQRHERFDSIYGDIPWTRVWKQSVDVATLADELETWEESGDTGDVVDLYGDLENGTWQIDSAVFDLIISGEPETDLPRAHPATSTLGSLRSHLVESQYLEYLRDLGDLVVDQIDAGSPFAGESHAHQFFAEEQEHLQSGESVALFIVDALRFDLAHKLSESIRRELPQLEVNENTWVGTLPSDTQFGKAALTPGSKFSFNIELQNGDLVPERNGRKITNHRRRTLLENDGWSYIMQDEDDDVGWSSEQVAYYWNDIDETGENELTNFEELFSDRIEAISNIICEKLRKGEWDRAYILSDHGFVSLPGHVDIDDIRPPADEEKVSRRWIAGTDLGSDAPGVLLDEDAHLGYLDDDAKISILTDPIQRFRNQGLPDARFYHGGALPQEFVLNFVTITQE
jgi:hypothetical protein